MTTLTFNRINNYLGLQAREARWPQRDQEAFIFAMGMWVGIMLGMTLCRIL